MAILETEINMTLDFNNPTAPVRLSFPSDGVCTSGQRYNLSYTYNGPSRYSILTSSIGIEITDGKLSIKNYLIIFIVAPLMWPH